jgi:hypothetical protein
MNDFRAAMIDAIGLAAGSKTSLSNNPAKKPEPFDGEISKYKTFRNATVIYVQAIKQDNDKIIAALSNLTSGTADSWAQAFMQNHAGAVEKNTYKWEDFLKDMDDFWRDPYEAREARVKLFKMKQGTLRAHEFLVEFDRVRLQADMDCTNYANNALVVEHLERSMNQDLVEIVTNEYNTNKRGRLNYIDEMRYLDQIDVDTHTLRRRELDHDITYSEFAELAKLHDNQVRRREEMNKGKAKYVPVIPTRNFQYLARQPEQKVAGPVKYTGRQPDVIPMDIDRADKMRNGLCFNCNEKGHLSRDCTKPRKPRAGNSNQRRTPMIRSAVADMDAEELKAYLLENWGKIDEIIAQDGEQEGEDFGDHQ